MKRAIAALAALGALGVASGLVTVRAAAGPAPVRAGAPPGPGVPVFYAPPSPALHVVRGFDAPAGPYGPGHRGVDLDVGTDRSVRAAAAGQVIFAGPVAGRGVVVVRHADGIRTEYEPVRPSVVAGASVARGSPIGVVASRHLGCPTADCLHWGARRGEAYLDPLTLLRPLGPLRLMPWPLER